MFRPKWLEQMDCGLDGQMVRIPHLISLGPGSGSSSQIELSITIEMDDTDGTDPQELVAVPGPNVGDEEVGGSMGNVRLDGPSDRHRDEFIGRRGSGRLPHLLFKDDPEKYMGMDPMFAARELGIEVPQLMQFVHAEPDIFPNPRHKLAEKEKKLSFSERIKQARGVASRLPPASRITASRGVDLRKPTRSPGVAALAGLKIGQDAGPPKVSDPATASHLYSCFFRRKPWLLSKSREDYIIFCDLGHKAKIVHLVMFLRLLPSTPTPPNATSPLLSSFFPLPSTTLLHLSSGTHPSPSHKQHASNLQTAVLESELSCIFTL